MTEGKNIPMSKVNVVVMSAITWLYDEGDVLSISSGSLPYEINCPNYKKIGNIIIMFMTLLLNIIK